MQAKRVLSLLLCLCLLLSAFGGALSVSAVDATDMPSPAVHLDFETDSGWTVGNNVTVTKGSSVSVTDGGKVGGRSLSFPNASNKKEGMVYWDANAYDPFDNTQTSGATVSMWVNVTSHSNNSYLFAYGWYHNRFYLGWDGSTFKLSVRNTSKSNTNQDLAINDAALNGSWALVTITWESNGTWTVYINGKAAGSYTLDTMYSPYVLAAQKSGATDPQRTDFAWTDYVSIGGTTFWAGESNRNTPVMLVDDFSIYTQSLTADQVWYLFSAEVAASSAADAVNQQISALTDAGENVTLEDLQTAQAAYDALSTADQAYVNDTALAAAWSVYYNTKANANGGKLLSLNFEDDTTSDILGRVTPNLGSSVEIAAGGKYGAKSASVTANVKTMEGTVNWRADDYDPFLYTENGTTISMWVNLSAKGSQTYLFSYGLFGYRIYIGYGDSGNFEVSLRNEATVGTLTLSLSSDQIPLNQWTLLTVTCDAQKNWNVYVDGELANANPANWNYSMFDIATAAKSAPTLKHENSNAYTNYYTISGASYWLLPNTAGIRNNAVAKYDEFTIYNRALTAAEITALCNVVVSDENAKAVAAEINKLDGLSGDALAAQMEKISQLYNALSAAEQELVSNRGTYLYDLAKEQVEALTDLEVSYLPDYRNALEAAEAAVATAKAADADVADLEAVVTQARQDYTLALKALVRLDNQEDVTVLSGPNLGTDNGERVEMLFDSSLSTKMGTNQLTCTVTWKTDSFYTIGAYGMVTGTDSAQWTNRNPKGWKLEGSLDNVTWETIDEVADSGMENVNNTEYQFYPDNVGTYQYFRITFTGTYGAAYLQLDEIWLYAVAGEEISYDAQAVVDLIAAIDSLPAVDDAQFPIALQAAEAAYNAMNKYEQADVTNVAALQEALAARATLYPAQLYGFSGADIEAVIVEGNTALVLVKAGVDLAQVSAKPQLSAGSSTALDNAGTLDFSNEFTLHVTQEYGEEADYTVKAYSADAVKSADKVEAAPVSKMAANLPVYLYRNDMADAKDAVIAYQALTDLQKLLVTYGQRAADAAVRMEELENSPIRITCVGSSCTEGYGCSDFNGAKTMSYPGQMDTMLGDDFTVYNAGLSGSTVVDVPPAGVSVYSYMSQANYQRGLASEPDIMILFVGSNDATSGRWNVAGYKEAFIRDYKMIIDAYLALPSHPYIFVSYPYDSTASDRHQYVPEVMEIMDQLQAEYNCGLIDFYTITNQLITENYSKYWADGVHPNDAGYEKVAEVGAAAILEYVNGLAEGSKATGIQADGVSLEGFNADTTAYTIDCSTGHSPTITATAADGYTVRVRQATLSNPVATVYVEAERGDYGTAYEIVMNDIGVDPEDQQATDTVIELISALGESPAQEAVTAARAAYDALTDAQKALVTNYDVLLAAEQTVQPPDPVIMGDLNKDGVLSVTDVVLLRKAILNNTRATQEPAGDMNGDGTLSVTDVVLLRKAILAAK